MCTYSHAALGFARFCKTDYVHTYPTPLTLRQQEILIGVSDWLGVRDYDGLYVFSMAALDLLVAIVAYKVIMKLWRRRHTGRRSERA
ncbi:MULTISPECIES: hypothetical protein [unclassified Caballeronia]|uniref:hypothetical protein n=1 Tax=unclassified Caballeronia TaxID=2646786 RepID=UPI002028E466|nr:MULTISPECIES: hypothetical protein [unclassified Caballeronia]